MTRMWNRIITFILLLAYAPMVGMASPNLVWCIGSDGHSAIETVKNDGDHHTPISKIEGNTTPQSHQAALIEPHPDDCIDTAIFTKTVNARNQLTALAWLDVSDAKGKGLSLTARPIDLNCSQGNISAHMRQTTPFPQLDQLKTVILLT